MHSLGDVEPTWDADEIAAMQRWYAACDLIASFPPAHDAERLKNQSGGAGKGVSFEPADCASGAEEIDCAVWQNRLRIGRSENVRESNHVVNATGDDAYERGLRMGEIRNVQHAGAVLRPVPGVANVYGHRVVFLPRRIQDPWCRANDAGG